MDKKPTRAQQRAINDEAAAEVREQSRTEMFAAAKRNQDDINEREQQAADDEARALARASAYHPEPLPTKPQGLTTPSWWQRITHWFGF